MSLEQAISANTEAIRALIAAIGTVSIPSATVELRAEPAAAGTPLTAAQAEAALFNQHGKAAAEAPAAAAPKADKPKAASTKPAAQAPAAQPAAETPPFQADTTAAAPTFEQVRDAIMGLSKAKGRDPVVALLQRFGASKVPDIRPEFYVSTLDLVRRAMVGEDIAASMNEAGV